MMTTNYIPGLGWTTTPATIDRSKPMADRQSEAERASQLTDKSLAAGGLKYDGTLDGSRTVKHEVLHDHQHVPLTAPTDDEIKDLADETVNKLAAGDYEPADDFDDGEGYGEDELDDPGFETGIADKSAIIDVGDTVYVPMYKSRAVVKAVEKTGNLTVELNGRFVTVAPAEVMPDGSQSLAE